MFSGYELFRNLAHGKKLKNPKREAFKQFLLDPGVQCVCVVCDNGDLQITLIDMYGPIVVIVVAVLWCENGFVNGS